MIRELVRDEAILSTPCEPATADDIELADDLVDTVMSLEDCACLAANQIGVTKAMGVYLDDDEDPHVILNPRILMGLGASRVVEGCLTRDEPSKVRRFQKVKVTYDEIVDGQLKTRKRDHTGWVAQMIQHIVDHCAGKLV